MPASLPSRAPGDLGAVLSNIRAPVSNELSAVNVEKIKDWIIALATELGLTDGSTSGSVWEALASAGGGGAWDFYEVRGDDLSPTTLDARSAVITCYNGDGDARMLLPAASDSAGVVYMIRKIGGTDGYAITVTPNGADEFEGDSGEREIPYSRDGVYASNLSPAPAWMIFSDGVAWRLGLCWGLDGDRRPDLAFSHTTATPTLLETDYALRSIRLYDTTSNAIAIALPNPADARVIGKKVRLVRTNASGTNKISLTRFSGESINGVAASFDLPGSATAARGEWDLQSDGANWHVVTLSETAPAALTSTAASALGRSASAGAATTAARADHVHDRSVVTLGSTISSSVALPDQDFVYVDTTSGAISLTLPGGTGAKRWDIAKINAGANTITLVRAASETIQGTGANFLLPDSDSTVFPSWTLIRDASGNYRVL